MINSSTLLLLGLLVGNNQHLCNGLLTPTQSQYSLRPSIATKQASRPLNLLGTPISENDTDNAAEIDSEEIFVLTFPPIVIAAAFLTYDETAKLFHDFVVIASGRTFEFVDGGAELDSLLRPALTGPISGLVSILFSTVVATTIGKLFERYEGMTMEVANILDDLQLLSLHTNFFPSKYKKPMRKLIGQFTTNFKSACLDPSTSDESRQKLNDENQLILGDIMIQLHEFNQDGEVEKNDKAMDEAYDRLNDVIKRRSNLENLYEACFPLWHYGSICILGLGICLIFLILTDKPALLLLGDFQLRVCWSILLGSFSMLTVTIVDLITPLQGGYKIRIEPHLIDEQQGYLDDE